MIAIIRSIRTEFIKIILHIIRREKVKKCIAHDENNIEGKSEVENDSIFFQTKERNNNHPSRTFEYSKNKCISNSEQFKSNEHF